MLKREVKLRGKADTTLKFNARMYTVEAWAVSKLAATARAMAGSISISRHLFPFQQRITITKNSKRIIGNGGTARKAKACGRFAHTNKNANGLTLTSTVQH